MACAEPGSAGQPRTPKAPLPPGPKSSPLPVAGVLQASTWRGIPERDIPTFGAEWPDTEVTLKLHAEVPWPDALCPECSAEHRAVPSMSSLSHGLGQQLQATKASLWRDGMQQRTWAKPCSRAASCTHLQQTLRCNTWIMY